MHACTNWAADVGQRWGIEELRKPKIELALLDDNADCDVPLRFEKRTITMKKTAAGMGTKINFIGLLLPGQPGYFHLFADLSPR